MLTKENLKEFAHYDPDTGCFVWIKNPKYHTRKGFPVGGIVKYRKLRYRKTPFEGRLIHVHRLIFLYMTGSIPTQVDHVDGNGLNNRWSNLRGVTNAENCKNRRLHSNNKSGISGIRLDKNTNKWIVDISDGGNRYHLGVFTDFLLACCVRKRAELKFGYHKNHGR